MNTLQLHSSGKNDYIKVLKEQFNLVKKFILIDNVLNKDEKQKKIDILKQELKRKVKNTNKNFY